MIKTTLIAIALLSTLGACSNQSPENAERQSAQYESEEKDGDELTETFTYEKLCEVDQGKDYGTDNGDDDDASQNDDDDNASQNDDDDTEEPACEDEMITLKLTDEMVSSVEYKKGEESKELELTFDATVELEAIEDLSVSTFDEIFEIVGELETLESDDTMPADEIEPADDAQDEQGEEAAEEEEEVTE